MAAGRVAQSCLAADVLAQGKLIGTLEVSQQINAIVPYLPHQQASWDQIWASGKFHATVMPDLPGVANLTDLLPNLRGRGQKLREGGPDPIEMPVEAPPGFFRVRTVAAQLKSRSDVSRQMQTTAAQIANTCQALGSQSPILREDSFPGLTEESQAGNSSEVVLRKEQESQLGGRENESHLGGRENEAQGALLLVSGGHPVRQLPVVRNFFRTNARTMLREGHRLRKDGLIPRGVQLWATENPLVNNIHSLERKLDAGAEAIITQPPLLPDTFERWWAEVDRRGLTGSTRLIVGLPFLSSLKNLDFWLMLTNASGSAEADSVRQNWAEHERQAAGDPGRQLDFRLQQTKECLRKIESLPGVRGVHLMPVTKRGWRDLLTLIDGGAFDT